MRNRVEGEREPDIGKGEERVGSIAALPVRELSLSFRSPKQHALYRPKWSQDDEKRN